MKYTATVDGEIFQIEFGPGSRTWINGQPYEVDLMRVGGQYSLLLDHLSYEVHVALAEGNGHHVTVGGRPYHTMLQRGHRDRHPPNGSVKASRDGKRQPGQLSADVEMRAPLPGLLVKMEVDQGASVEEQDVVAVLESMKMNLELRAPHGGVVSDLLVAPGTQVGQDQVLAIIRPNGAPSKDG